MANPTPSDPQAGKDRSAPLVRWSRLARRVIELCLPIWFAVFCLIMLIGFQRRGLLGIDARIYSRAAAAWMAGGDPWQSAVDGFAFAAPPPTLLPFLPTAFLGELASAVLWVAVSALAGAWLVRRLELPWWWLLFPPLVNGVLSGNPDVVLVALVVQGSTLAGVIAPFLKIYAVFPLIGARRWTALVVVAGALAVTAPLLPWARYLAESGDITPTLARQAAGYSAFGTPWLMGIAVVALLIVGTYRAGWLVVPALWPYTQLHYSVLALPALANSGAGAVATLTASFLLAQQIPWTPAFAVIALAIGTLVRWVRSRGLIPPQRSAMRR